MTTTTQTPDPRYVTVPTRAQAHTLNSIQDASESIRSAAANIRRTLDLVVEHLDEGYHVNRLGELQSRGPEFDRLCGLREQAVETAMMLDCAPEWINLAAKGTGTFFSSEERTDG